MVKEFDKLSSQAAEWAKFTRSFWLYLGVSLPFYVIPAGGLPKYKQVLRMIALEKKVNPVRHEN